MHRFARRHPRITVDPSVLYIDDGDILTSAGTVAGIDLCLHLVRRDHGASLANTVARRLVVAPHRDGGQAQYVEHPVPEQVNGTLGTLLEWMEQHHRQPLTIDALARRVHLSRRQFIRRFTATTGTSPYAWLLHRRVLEARHLLESTSPSKQSPHTPASAAPKHCGCTSVAMSAAPQAPTEPPSLPPTDHTTSGRAQRPH